VGGLLDTPLTRQLGIEVPLICGAMYPCSNPELVAAVSEAGGIGVLQPLSLVYVHGHEFAAGLALLRGLTAKPVGMNVIVERSSKVYRERMERFVDQAIAGGVRFFVTSLGNPRWVVEKAHAAGGFVYHDVTERKWAVKGLEAGVDGLIAVNDRAGGHAGPKSAEALIAELGDLGVPVVCAGGVGDEEAFVRALRMGYAGVQMGTRFIAATECTAHPDYKQAILRAGADDIVLTERITGVPVAVIRTPYIDKTGTKAGPLARWMLRGQKTKHWMRTIFALQSVWKLKRSSLRSFSYRDYLQAGKSVAGIERIEPAGEIVRRFRAAARRAEGAVAALALTLTLALLGGCKGGPSAVEQAEQKAAAMTGGVPAHGRELIPRYGCQNCHVIPGVEGAVGKVGPSLAGIASRAQLAGKLPNQPANLLLWIREPQRVSPGTAMPELGVTEQDGKDIAAYLYTLR
jgi:nitronate monooxygenase